MANYYTKTQSDSLLEAKVKTNNVYFDCCVLDAIQGADYRRCVLGLLPLSTSSYQNNGYYTWGLINQMRSSGGGTNWYLVHAFDNWNGAPGMCIHTLTGHSRIVSTSMITDSTEGWRPCIFKYNNTYYGGLEIYPGASASRIFTFIGYHISVRPFVIYYYNTHTSTVLNSEIYNSLNFTLGSSYIKEENTNLYSNKYSINMTLVN